MSILEIIFNLNNLCWFLIALIYSITLWTVIRPIGISNFFCYLVTSH